MRACLCVYRCASVRERENKTDGACVSSWSKADLIVRNVEESVQAIHEGITENEKRASRDQQLTEKEREKCENGKSEHMEHIRN